ncbi:hypothetical protein CDL15_Pgr028133 [Punica granatum]|uniref:Uncharacterized protein n=1 Tax=Punica granatum TaxID=22663 RepID=A0A218WVM1_PUNGR|nr:hypothetical protein CDL15_Pgr028133 [Punica granatum]
MDFASLPPVPSPIVRRTRFPPPPRSLPDSQAGAILDMPRSVGFHSRCPENHSTLTGALARAPSSVGVAVSGSMRSGARAPGSVGVAASGSMRSD